jgi:WD40 repeat protein
VLEGHTDRVTAVVLTGDGRAISASEDSTLRVWNLESGKCQQVLAGHTSAVSAVVLTGDGRAISAAWDNTLRVWNLETVREVLQIYIEGITELQVFPNHGILLGDHRGDLYCVELV